MTTKKPVHVEFSRDGLRDLIAVGRWWREHHPARPGRFDDEMATTIAFLEQTPEGAQIALTRRYKNARVRVLRDTGHLVVYRYAKTKRVVTILAVRASKATAERP